jgi:PAS domain S-box-containing protein
LAEQRSPSDKSDTESLVYRNQLLSQEIRRRVDLLAAINTVATTVSQSLDLQATLQTALDAVMSVIKIDAAGISLVDDVAGELVMRAQRGWKYDFVTTPMRIPLGQGLSGQVVSQDQVIVTGDLSDDPRLAVRQFAEEHVQAMALVPMHARGRVVGVLSVMNYTPYQFQDEEITVLRAVADQVGVALDNARLYESTKEQSSRLSAVLNSSADAIIATDSHGQIYLINARAQMLFDRRPHDLVGMPLRQAPLHPKLREGLLRSLDSQGDLNTVFQVTLEDGRYLSVIVSPVYSHPGLESDQEAKGWVLVVRDITHLREAEQARVNFIHAAAHDLRNPLGATMGALVMLENDLGEVSEIHREIITIGLQSVNRMQELIDNLLNLEHIESGVGVQFKRVDLRDVIERAMVDMQQNAVNRNQTLGLDVPPTLPPIRGDVHWLYRALTNLLANATKYTQHGGTITVRAYAQGEQVFLEVEDNGPGVPPEIQTRLFERFYRGPNHDNEVKGSGLGLAIVKSVAEQHGGRTFVQSQVGQGSIFGMIFPVLVETPDDSPSNGAHD